MKHRRGRFILFLSKGLFLIVLVTVFFLGQIYFYEETLFYFWGNVVLIMIYTAVLYLTSRIYNGFNFSSAGVQENIVSWVLCLIIVNAVQFFILSLVASLRLNVSALLPPSGFGIMLGVQVALTIPVTVVLNALYYRFNPAHDTMIIYGDAEKLRVYKKVIEKQRRDFIVVDAVSQYEQTGTLIDAINKVQSVFFLDVEETKQEGFLEYCYLNGKYAYILPTFSRVLIHTAGTIWLSNTPVFSLTKPEPDTGTLVIKRLIDMVASSLAIIISSPVMLIVSIAVRLHDGHPAIYKQERVTKGGRRFNIYKFRSMVPDAEDDGIPRLTAKDDPRITSVGQFIRRTRIDELPQLFNVFTGAMSMVGPRPERPEIAKMYEDAYPNFAFRTKVKAGITGLAQIYGRYNTAPEDKLFLDIMYIETFSIWQDLKLMMQTVSVLFKPASTEGIDGDSITALR